MEIKLNLLGSTHLLEHVCDDTYMYAGILFLKNFVHAACLFTLAVCGLQQYCDVQFWRPLYLKSVLCNEVIHCSLKYGAGAVVYSIYVGVCLCPMYMHMYVCICSIYVSLNYLYLRKPTSDFNSGNGFLCRVMNYTRNIQNLKTQNFLLKDRIVGTH